MAILRQIKPWVYLNYAKTQLNMGAAYGELPDGDCEGNLKRAIHCYEEALHYLTPRMDPLNYAKAQLNMTVANIELPGGKGAEKLERAIQQYQEILRVLTPENDLLSYLKAAGHLALASICASRGRSHFWTFCTSGD